MSCDSCVRRKRKCNGSLPCSVCVRVGAGEECAYSARRRVSAVRRSRSMMPLPLS
ncbi:unnamed protein product [Discosporangium mesarthrocarpum]